MGTGGFGAEALDLVLFVGLVVALEPEPVRLALPGQDVRGDAVEEPPVVAGDHGAAGEVEQRVLQRGERVHVQVVGWLVEEEQVAALLEGERQVDPVSLATGQDAGQLLLVRALEPERGHVGPARDLGVARVDVRLPVGDRFPDVLVGGDPAAALVDVGDVHRLANADGPPVGLLLAHDHLEQGGLADAVRADDTDDAVAWQREAQPVEQHAVAEALDQLFGLDHDVAEARARRDLDLLEVELAPGVGLGGHLLVAVEPGPALGLPRTRVGPHPLQFLFEALAPLGVLGALDLEPGRLGVQVGGVVALVGVGVPAVELKDPLGRVFQEVPVVGDGDDGARVVLQVLLQPLDALCVQVVGGLVQQQQVRLGQQELTERHPAALATGQLCDGRIRRRAAQRVHRLLELTVQVPGVAVIQLLLKPAHFLEQLIGVLGGHLLGDLVVLVQHRLGLGDALLDVPQNRLVLVELRLLSEQPDRKPRHQPRLTIGGLLDTGHQLQQSGLAGTVRSHDADLGSRQERQRDVVEDYLVAVRLAHSTHLVDELRHDT